MPYMRAINLELEFKFLFSKFIGLGLNSPIIKLDRVRLALLK